MIVPAYRAERTLARCIESLLAQELDRPHEVVVVASGSWPEELPRMPDDPRLIVVTHVPRLDAAPARNRGVSRARGRLLAFTDADVVCPPGWLTGLIEAAGNGHRCVAGSVANGTPGSALGTVEYLSLFIDLHPRRPARTAWHGATCNLLVPAGLWRELGPFPEDMRGGEDTVLTVRARRRGLFAFAPDVTVTHLNRTELVPMLIHQYEFGAYVARLSRRIPVRMRVLTRYSPLAPIAAVLRVASIYWRVAAWVPRDLARAVTLLPLLALACLSWGAGLGIEGARLDVKAVGDRLGVRRRA